MAIDVRTLTWGQPNLVYKQLTDSSAAVETTDETSFDAYPTFTAGCFAAGDVLQYYFGGTVATTSTPTITLALFWGTAAGTLLLRGRAMLLTATGEDSWFCRGYVVFRTATTVVASLHTIVKTSATTFIGDDICTPAGTTTTISQASDTPLSIAHDEDVSTGITYTITQNIGLVWHHRYGL